MVPTVCTMEGALCSMRWIYLALSLLEASDNWTHGTHEGFFFHCCGGVPRKSFGFDFCMGHFVHTPPLMSVRPQSGLSTIHVLRGDLGMFQFHTSH
jgi:hypothetical protein